MARPAGKGKKRRDAPRQLQATAAEHDLDRLFRALTVAESDPGTVDAELRRITEGDSRAFPHILRRLGRVSPREQCLLVQSVKRLGNPELIRDLSKSLSNREISLKARAETVALLRETGSIPDPQLASEVEKANALVLQASTGPGDEGEPAEVEAVSADLGALPKTAALMALEELARTDLRRALEIFHALVRSHPGDIDCALLTVQALDNVVRRDAAQYLMELLDRCDSRILHRAIRRALYKLKAAGIQATASDIDKERTSVLSTPEFRFIAAHASHIDGDGNRSFYLAKTKPMGGVHLIFAAANDRKGLLDSAVIELDKHEYQQVRLKIEEEGIFVDMDPCYALAQVRSAATKNRSTGTALPPEYVTNQSLFEGPEPTREEPAALIYAEVSTEELATLPSRLNDSIALFETEEFADWKLPADDMAPYLYEYEEVEESRIIVSDVLKRERLEEVYRKAASGLMEGDLRGLLKARLEEMAYVLRRKGQKESGDSALAAAVALEADSPVPPEKHPFVLELVKRSMVAAAKESKEKVIARVNEEKNASS